MEAYKCEDCGNTMEFTIISVTNVWKEQDGDNYSEDVTEVVVCGKCKSSNVHI